MKTGVILDTDIGYDPDDLFALLLLLNSPELKLDLIVTGDEVNGKRAQFTRMILDKYRHQDLKVVQGSSLGNNNFLVDELIQDISCHIDDDYLKAMQQVMDASDKVVYIGIQGFTNLANLLKSFPENKEKLQICQMGGAVDYCRRPGWIEHNIKIDPNAARYVLSSGVNISLVMAQTTFNPIYRIDNGHEIFKKLESSNNPVYNMLARHCELFHEAKGFWTYMHDPLAVSAAMGKDFVDFYESGIYMDDGFGLHNLQELPRLRLSKQESKGKEFMQFLSDRLFS